MHRCTGGGRGIAESVGVHQAALDNLQGHRGRDIPRKGNPDTGPTAHIDTLPVDEDPLTDRSVPHS